MGEQFFAFSDSPGLPPLTGPQQAAMAYIISVNASIVSDSGGTCVCNDTAGDLCVSDTEYMSCVAEVRRDLITTTAAISALSSFLMGALANLPVGMAPGLGLNAYVSVS